MTEYDRIFIDNLNDILKSGTEYESRAVWPDDGEKAHCIKKFAIVNTYNEDLSNKPPIGTIRKFPIKNCIDELLWIWQRKSNNIKDLRSHIWDAWADSNGSIGAAYGYQVASKLRVVKSTKQISENEYESVTEYLDQTDYVIHELKNNPFSRKIITDLYSIDQISLMGLDPCCYSCTWNVSEIEGERYLNLLLNQRSQDMIVANNWNVFQYWILQNMFANECNMKVGKLVHVIADAHIYDRHIDIAQHMIGISSKTENFCDPKVVIPKKSFYDYTIHDFSLEDYIYLENIKNIPVAV